MPSGEFLQIFLYSDEADIVTCLLLMVYLISLFPHMLRYRLKIIRAFKYLHLISHGHLWIGEIVLCVISFLVFFAAIFNLKHINLYPIDHMICSSIVCNPQIHNVKFTNGLQVYLIY